MITLLFSLVFFESLHCLKRNIKQTFRTMEISCSKFNITHKKSKYLLLKNHNLLLLRNKSLQFHLYTVILIFPPHLGQKCFFPVHIKRTGIINVFYCAIAFYSSFLLLFSIRLISSIGILFLHVGQ